jgi:hypothetical protein
VIGSFILGLCFLGVTAIGFGGVVPPLLAAASLGVGSFLLYCAVHTATSEVSVFASGHVRLGQVAGAIASLSIAVSLFWTVGVYGTRSGEALARYLAYDPAFRPQVIVYSRDDLHLQGGGVNGVELSHEEGAMRYRYDGFRLLIYSNSRWFLIPRTWSEEGRNPVRVLLDDGSVRVEILR